MGSLCFAFPTPIAFLTSSTQILVCYLLQQPVNKYQDKTHVGKKPNMIFSAHWGVASLPMKTMITWVWWCFWPKQEKNPSLLETHCRAEDGLLPWDTVSFGPVQGLWLQECVCWKMEELHFRSMLSSVSWLCWRHFRGCPAWPVVGSSLETRAVLPKLSPCPWDSIPTHPSPLVFSSHSALLSICWYSVLPQLAAQKKKKLKNQLFSFPNLALFRHQNRQE